MNDRCPSDPVSTWPNAQGDALVVDRHGGLSFLFDYSHQVPPEAASNVTNWESGTSYSVGDVVWNAQEGGYYCCKVAHHPLDPSEDSTHWEVVSAPEEWSEDQDWSVDDLAATWGTPYVCISAHTGTYNRPENDADESHWSLIEPAPRVAGDGSMTALYYYCIQAHTASSQAYIGHPSYWQVFDKRWYEWWLSIVPDANGASFNPLEGGVMAGLDEIMDAIDYLNDGAGTDGHKDWRLPNEFEARVTRCFEDGKLWSDFSPPSLPAMSVWYAGPCWVVMFAYWTGTPCKPGDGSNVYAVLVEGLYYPASGGNWVPEAPVRKASQGIEYRPAVTDKYAMAPEGCPVIFIARPVRGGVVES